MGLVHRVKLDDFLSTNFVITLRNIIPEASNDFIINVWSYLYITDGVDHSSSAYMLHILPVSIIDGFLFSSKLLITNCFYISTVEIVPHIYEVLKVFIYDISIFV